MYRHQKIALTGLLLVTFFSATLAMAGNDDDREHGGHDDDRDGPEMTSVCHATHSEKDPYVLVKMSVDGLPGHGDHDGDIIPAPAGGCPDKPPHEREKILDACRDGIDNDGDNLVDLDDPDCGAFMPILIVKKHVINNDGGARNAGDFTINASGTSVSPNIFSGSMDGTTVRLRPGAYRVSEETAEGYDASFASSCSGEIAIGESKTCVVTNDDVRRTTCVLEIEKTVNATSSVPGDVLTYTVNVRNVGTADCTGGGIRIEDRIPVELMLVSATSSANVSSGYASKPLFDGAILRWNAHEFTPQESGWVSWTGTVREPSTCGSFDVANSARTTAQELQDVWVESNTVHTAVNAPCDAGLPIVHTGPATDIATSTAMLHGSIDPQNATATWQFAYGTSTAFGVMTPNETASSGTVTQASSNLFGLLPGTTYFFRMIGTNASGTANGETLSFDTVSSTQGGGGGGSGGGATSSAPTVLTEPATNVATSTATLNGFVNPNGATTTWYFAYGTSSSTLQSSTTLLSLANSTNTQSVSSTLAGLAPGTTYSFRLTAENGNGTADGEILALTTVTSTSATSTTDTGNNGTGGNSGGGGGGSGGGGSAPISVTVTGGGGLPIYGSSRSVATGGGSSNGGTGPGNGQVLGASTSCGIYLDDYIRLGLNNDPDQVKKLQSFLNEEMSLQIPLTGFYGPITFAAVEAFQVKYWEKILLPWVPFGLKTAQTPTGYVYKTTRWWLNAIVCPQLGIPQPALP